MTEVWREIPGYEGLYEVSNIGRVRKLLIRKVAIDDKNREIMALSKGGKVKRVAVSVLFAAAFIGSRLVGLLVCHNDGDKRNNVESNLRYDTALANALDRARHGRTIRGEKQPLRNSQKRTLSLFDCNTR